MDRLWKEKTAKGDSQRYLKEKARASLQCPDPHPRPFSIFAKIMRKRRRVPSEAEFHFYFRNMARYMPLKGIPFSEIALFAILEKGTGGVEDLETEDWHTLICLS